MGTGLPGLHFWFPAMQCIVSLGYQRPSPCQFRNLSGIKASDSQSDKLPEPPYVKPKPSSSKANCQSIWVEVALKLVVVGIVAVPVAAALPQLWLWDRVYSESLLVE